jgi:hypothetical protein
LYCYKKSYTPYRRVEMVGSKMPRTLQIRDIPMSFKTFPHIKKKLIKMAESGDRSVSREMERLIRDAPFKG